MPAAPGPQVLVLHPGKTERLNRLEDDRMLQTCDESKPHCRRCQVRGVECSYASGSESSGSDNNSPLEMISRPQKPSTTDFSLTLASMTAQIDESLSIGSDFNAPSLTQPYSLVAFQHFMKWSTASVGLPAIRAVMESDMVQVAFSTPYLLYTILGVGMLHLNRASRSRDAGQRCAEAHFWQQAIRLYQDALLPGVNQKNFDALISTCMFMGVVSICPENFEPTDSWVLTNNPADMNWLCLQSGLRCLLEPAARYLPGSIWETAFKGYEEVECQLFNYDDQVGRQGLDPLFADFCGIDDLSTAMTSPYYTPLRQITTLIQLDKNMPNAARCTTFMGRLEFEFLDLLRSRDPPALIILAHWMGLMCLLTEWQPWVEGRLRKECAAICMYLERSSDPRIPPLLEFPALACGYVQPVSIS
ncbi:Zn(II)2Cys6 transcription factor domain-containing protein [Aspergillus affinis]|uniref:Zn(II)2Cys6 transcription factor domain-containing protein n=1 Tax=Aspergillus affinis TaxID=1070780 RepID=UPI0022FEA7F6|nr:putative C6 transcription factor [Aspergillus affinis]KAI9042502.1 putative C6 transcription factor [Aspergillus affinis]